MSGRPRSARPGQLSDLRLSSIFSHNLGQVHSTSYVGKIPLPVHSIKETENKVLWAQLTWRTTFSVCTTLHHALSSLYPAANLSSVRTHSILVEAPFPPYLWSFLCEPVYLCPQALSPCSRKRPKRCPSLQEHKETVACLGVKQYYEEGSHASTGSVTVQGI